MPQVFDDADGRRIAFQVWDWAPTGQSYTFTQFFVRESDGDYHTTHHVSQLRALRREELSRVLQDTGFSDIDWAYAGGERVLSTDRDCTPWVMSMA